MNLFHYITLCQHFCYITTMQFILHYVMGILFMLHSTLILLSLMYMDSLTVLAKPCPSLPTMLKLSIVVGCPVVVWRLCIGEVLLGVPCVFPQMFWQIQGIKGFIDIKLNISTLKRNIDKYKLLHIWELQIKYQ